MKINVTPWSSKCETWLSDPLQVRLITSIRRVQISNLSEVNVNHHLHGTKKKLLCLLVILIQIFYKKRRHTTIIYYVVKLKI